MVVVTIQCWWLNTMVVVKYNGDCYIDCWWLNTMVVVK